MHLFPQGSCLSLLLLWCRGFGKAARVGCQNTNKKRNPQSVFIMHTCTSCTLVLNISSGMLERCVYCSIHELIQESTCVLLLRKQVIPSVTKAVGGRGIFAFLGRGQHNCSPLPKIAKMPLFFVNSNIYTKNSFVLLICHCEGKTTL